MIAAAGSGMARAIGASLVVGAVVQLVAWRMLRRFGRGRMLAAWSAGAFLRVLALVVYAWVVVPALGLSLAPALLSLVSVFFVTTLAESVLLARLGN